MVSLIRYIIFFDVAVVSRAEKHLVSVFHGGKKAVLMLNSCLPESLHPVFVLIGFSQSHARYLKLTVYHGQYELIINLFVLLCAVHSLIIVFFNSFIVIVVVFIVHSV